jgi:hypothetical protein
MEEQAGKPLRFRNPIQVNLNMNNSGEWESLPDGGRFGDFVSKPTEQSQSNK